MHFINSKWAKHLQYDVQQLQICTRISTIVQKGWYMLLFFLMWPKSDGQLSWESSKLHIRRGSCCTSDKWKNTMHITLCWVMHGRHNYEWHLPIAVGEMLVCCGMRPVTSTDACCKLECQPEPSCFTSFGTVAMWLPCRMSRVSHVFLMLFHILIRLRQTPSPAPSPYTTSLRHSLQHVHYFDM